MEPRRVLGLAGSSSFWLVGDTLSDLVDRRLPLRGAGLSTFPSSTLFDKEPKKN